MVQELTLLATQVADAAAKGAPTLVGLLERFDYSVHLGDLLVTGVLGLIGHGLRKWYRLAEKFVNRVDFIGTMTERNSIILDVHSKSLYDNGILKISPEELDEFVAMKIQARTWST